MVICLVVLVFLSLGVEEVDCLFGRPETQAGKASFPFVSVNLSLCLISTFPQHSKSVNCTESTMLEENTTLHILTATLSIKVLLF